MISRIISFVLLSSAVLFSCLVSVAAFAQTAGPNAPVPAPQSLASGPRIWLQENQPLPVQHVPVTLSSGQGMKVADSSAVAGLNSAQPVSLTAADLDADGYEDLVVGYTTGSAGFISIHRGNIDAFAPQSDASFQAIAHGKFPSPFLLEAKTFSVPISPDLIAVGDFTGNGNKDLAIGARGGNRLLILPGDGKGGFSRPQTVNLSDGINSLAAGEFGSSHMLVLIVGGSRSLTLYVPASQGLAALASYSVPAPISNVLMGNFGDPGPDVAFLSGGNIQILRSSTMHATALSLPVPVRAFALGSFIWDRNGGSQVAFVAPDGSVKIAARNDFDPRSYTLAELQAIRQAGRSHQPAPDFVPVPSFPLGWKIVESFPGAAALGANQIPLIFRTRISINGADDVMLLNAPSGQLTLISHADGQPGAQTFQSGQVSLRPYNGTPIAALPMRLNADGRPGVLALHKGEIAPALMEAIPDPTFFVNTDNDPTPVSPITNACNNTSFMDLSSSCSLREAILRANGDTIMLQAGHTYSLTIGRGATQDYSGNTGALYVNHSATIVGGNQNTTVIQWGTPTPAGTTADLVMAVNEDIPSAAVPTFTNATASISNLTIQNGVNHGSIPGEDGFAGGIEFDTGLNGTANLTLTNVTVTNNSTTDGDGGGLAIFNTNDGTGAATITNSIISNNTPNESSTGGSGLGGGIYVGQPGKIILNNTQITGNNATQANNPKGQGGGIWAQGQTGITLVPSSAIHGGSIAGNHAAGEGGGVYTTQGITIDAGTVIDSNTSGVAGGGFWYNAGTGFTASLSKVTITNNSVTGSAPDGIGGGIRVDSETGNSFTMSFSRLAHNSATTEGSNLSNGTTGTGGGTVTATNNWWGTNAPSTTIDAQAGTTTFDPFIVLTHTANPTTIRINQSSTLTADMSKDNHGNGAALSGNLDEIVGLPITFDHAVLGTIPEAQPETLSANAQATATFNAGNVGGNGSADATVDQQTVTASITIVQPPSIAKSFNPTTVNVNTPSTITFSITNGNTIAIDANFTDTLPANLVVATITGLVNSCGGTVTATAASGSISFLNSALPAGTCSIQVNVQSAVDNTYNNSVTIDSTAAGNGNTSSASLTVITPPAITKAFGAAAVPLNGTTSLTFTINNPNKNTTLNGLSFTDSLPAGLVVANPNSLNNTCGGTATGAAGASSVTLSGGSLATGASCSVSVSVTPTTAGTKNNSVQVTSTNGGTGNTSNASLAVAGPPVLTKAFGAASIPLNGSTSLSFTIQNGNSATLTGIGFSDTLPAGLIVSTPSGLTGSCGGGTITATQATRAISLAGATLAGNASCTFAVNVTGTAAGLQNNTTSSVSSNEGGSGTAASASIIVVAPPSIAKAFNPSSIAVNATTGLSFTITNPNAVALAGVSFTDVLPAGLTVANSTIAGCGGTFTISGGNTIALSGGSLPANTACSIFSLPVTATQPGNFTNITGNVTSANGGTGNAATATLTVAGLTVTPTSIDFGDVDVKQLAVHTVTITNGGNTAAPVHISITPGAGSDANKFFFVSLCPGALSPRRSCKVEVIFFAPKPSSAADLGVSTATLNVTSGNTIQPVSLRVNVIDPEPKFNPDELSFGAHTVGSMTTKTITVTNVGFTPLVIQSVSVGGSNHSDFTATNLCTSSLPTGSACQIEVTFNPKAKGYRVAALTINSNDGQNRIPLVGTGK